MLDIFRDIVFEYEAHFEDVFVVLRRGIVGTNLGLFGPGLLLGTFAILVGFVSVSIGFVLDNIGALKSQDYLKLKPRLIVGAKSMMPLYLRTMRGRATISTLM